MTESRALGTPVWSEGGWRGCRRLRPAGHLVPPAPLAPGDLPGSPTALAAPFSRPAGPARAAAVATGHGRGAGGGMAIWPVRGGRPASLPAPRMTAPPSSPGAGWLWGRQHGLRTSPCRSGVRAAGIVRVNAHPVPPRAPRPCPLREAPQGASAASVSATPRPPAPRGPAWPPPRAPARPLPARPGRPPLGTRRRPAGGDAPPAPGVSAARACPRAWPGL